MATINRIQSDRRSMGFAALLITAGTIWLLSNINLISSAGVNIALSLWPLVLVAIGADLLLGQQYPRTSAFVIVFIAILVVFTSLLAPRLGVGVLTTTTGSYAEEVGNAESATIMLRPSVGNVKIHSLEQTEALFAATATYVGSIRFDVRGTRQRTIDFGQNEVSTTNWFGTDKDLSWDIGLSPTIPLNLSVNSGVGDAVLDLSELTLTNLQLSAGVGRVDLMLPGQETPYQVNVSGGVGMLALQIPEEADVDLTISSGVGNVDIDLPEDAAVRVSIEAGLGESTLPSWLERVNTGNENQIWQSAGFEKASRRITLNIHSGLGSLTIR
jgi:hypothetical protein